MSPTRKGQERRDGGDLFEIALHVYRYARRWAVGMSPNAEDVVIYDACIAVLNKHFAPQQLGTPQTPTATSDRFLRNGQESIEHTYSVPVTAEDAIVVLHSFARRYTNGRGSYTAALVNTTARELLERGVSLQRTIDTDGTIWAADGVGGLHDGLTETERAEALAVLPSDSRGERDGSPYSEDSYYIEHLSEQ